MTQERKIPLYTLEGVKDAQVTSHYFHTEDKLGLSMLRFLRKPCDDVVMIAHGLTTSSDMFIMPEHYNLVSYLLDQGFSDVFTLDFRMSNRHNYNLRRHRYNLDDVALYDHPKAIAEIKRIAGPGKRIHVICHCLGAVTFVMSLFSGLVPGVTSVAANSVTLTPRFEKFMYLKAAVAPFLTDYLLGESYLDPNWSEAPGLTPGKVVSWLVSQFHPECKVRACHMLSMMWGVGNPALYQHENLLDVTHERGGDLYGGTGINYHRHVRKMANFDGGHAIKYQKDPKYSRLPDDYLANAASVRTPVLFMTGRHNHVFTDSNIVCYERLDKITPGLHELKVYESYGHQDVFMGKNVAVDIFPSIVEFFRKHRDTAAK